MVDIMLSVLESNRDNDPFTPPANNWDWNHTTQLEEREREEEERERDYVTKREVGFRERKIRGLRKRERERQKEKDKRLEEKSR